jgi:hypothetical protein
MPTFSAMNAAERPTKAGFGRRWGVISTFASASISRSFIKYEPRDWNWRRVSSAITSSTTTEFGDEHSTPLSKVLPRTMSYAALARSADFSM